MTSQATQGPTTIAVVGAGNRANAYSQFARQWPNRMKIVAVVDPDEPKRRLFAARYGIPADRQFASHLELAARPRLADAVFNCTRDRLHRETSLPLLALGYNMLLEKPIALTEADLRGIISAADTHRCTVMICHVLRYAPFYARIKDLVTSGRIGRIISLNTLEAVSYHHMATGYVRGRWHQAEASASMLLNKCCHDLDIVAWLLQGISPIRVSSAGSLMQFRPENAPDGSAARCLDGCRIEPSCQYSAKLLYLDKKRWQGYAFPGILEPAKASDSERFEHLRKDSPWGRCVWHCDNDVVDHQSVLVEFENGVTATHDMFCATARPERRIHIVGSRGEIEGEMEAGLIKVRTPNFQPVPDSCDEEVIDINVDIGGDAAGHGGGDERLVSDFIAVLRNEPGARATTRIQDSLNGHLITFAADRARLTHQTIELKPA